MAFELSYGGVPLLIPDDDGAVIDFIDEFLPLDDMNDQAEHYTRQSDRMEARKYSHTVNLPRPTFAPPPPPRLNQLYWPTGATRWARGYFLVDTPRLDEINKQFKKGRKPLDLVAKNRDDEFSTSLYMLPPRQISAVKDSKQLLYLLPLVDERYLWKQRRASPEKLQPGTSWAALLSRLTNDLGITDFSNPSDMATSSWLWPDDHEFTRRHEDPTVLLDAVAWSLGGVVVRQLDGSVSIEQWADAVKTYDQNIDGDKEWERIAGGKLDPGPVAIQVVSTFRFMNQGAPCETVYSITKTAEDDVETELPTVSGTEFVAHVACYAEIKGGTFTPQNEFVPANQTALNAIAQSIAEAYYKQRERSYDETFARIKKWTFGALDDSVLYSFGTPNPIDDWQVEGALAEQSDDIEADVYRLVDPQWVTRVRSHAWDFGSTEYLNQERYSFHGVRWGRCISPALPPDPDITGHNCAYVVVNPCSDCQGSNPIATIQHEVILPLRQGFGIGLKAGDVISYEQASDCRWTIDSDYSVGTHRLKAVLTDKLWPAQIAAFFDPRTVYSLVTGAPVFTQGYYINNAWNNRSHACNRGGVVYLEWDQTLNFGLGGYYVEGVQKRPKQVVVNVSDTLNCLAQAKLMAAVEYTDDPGNYCTIALYDDCDDSTPAVQDCIAQYPSTPFDECFNCCGNTGGAESWETLILLGSFGGGPGGCCDLIQQSFLAFDAVTGAGSEAGISLNIKVDQCTWISNVWINGCSGAPFIICLRLSPYLDVFGPDPTATKVDATLSMADGQLVYNNDDFDCTLGDFLTLQTNNTGCDTVPSTFDVRPAGA